tara:strand:+ start:293 stop:1720 length:1428 start_codon:yes stop_codon:yes gene_type:complete
MAFLGSLGKSLGLSSSFGEGLVTGLATSVDKGLQEDMKRTQDNVDNLVIETYKGAVENKKEFDKMYKENKKLVENIAANMGGEQGIKHPQALQAAQTLINLKGLDGAFTLAQDYNKSFRMYGKHPTKSLLADETGNSTPITLSALTKSTVTPISMPDVSELGKSAAVGFMKMDFLGGKDTVGSDISTRAQALIKARGIDVNEKTIDLPPALKGKIDPLILGIKENPLEEKARLVTMLANAERDGTLTKEKEANIKGMIDITEGITRSLQTKKGLDYLTLERITAKTEETLTGMYDMKQKRNTMGIYTGADTKIQQQEILNNSKAYYTDLINKATFEGGDLRDGNDNFRKINFAITNNYNAVGVMINGVYTIQVDEKSEHLSYEQRKILNPKSPPPEKVKTGNPNEDNKSTTVQVGELKSSQEYVDELKALKNRYPDLAQSRITGVEKNFVKSYMAENEGTSMSEAQKVFRQLTQG